MAMKEFTRQKEKMPPDSYSKGNKIEHYKNFQWFKAEGFSLQSNLWTLVESHIVSFLVVLSAQTELFKFRWKGNCFFF